MNILFCLGSMDKGGTQRVVSNLANYFANDVKNKVSIITTKKGKVQYDINQSINIYSLDKKEYKRSNNFLRLYRLIKVIKKNNISIILTFQPEPSFRALIANLLLKRKIVISVRNDPHTEYKNKKRKFLMKLLYPKADMVILQTEDAKKYFEKIIDENRMTVIPNPINESFVNKKRYIGKRKKEIVTVGRLEKQKNQLLLIEAFSEISHMIPDYKLKIYGSGILKNELENRIKELNMEKKILLMGQVDNIADNINKSSMFVLTSDYEGMPNALMEAMALGLPCISTDCPCGGPRFLIKDKENGLLINVGDKQELKDAILFIINNSDISKKIGIKAHKICDYLNPNVIAKKWEMCIDTVNEGDKNEL